MEGSGLGRLQTEMVLALLLSIHETPISLSYFSLGIFPRYFLSSKQCAVKCGLYETLPRMARSFVLIKPTPFLFLACCTSTLCNIQKPVIKENTEDAYLNPGRGQGRGRSAELMPFLTLASALLGLRVP